MTNPNPDPHVWPQFHVTANLIEIQDRINAKIAQTIALEQARRSGLAYDEPVGYDGFGAPLYAHQVPALGTE